MAVQEIVLFYDLFIDPYVHRSVVLDGDHGRFLTRVHAHRVTSILACRFMLSLREFDSTIASMTNSELGPQLREHMASIKLEFAAQPSHSLPAFIASFAHPVHVDLNLVEKDLDASANNKSEAQEINAVIPAPEVSSHQSPISQPLGQLPELAESA